MSAGFPSTRQWHHLRRLLRPALHRRPALSQLTQAHPNRDAKPAQTAARTTRLMPCSVRTAATTSPPERCPGLLSLLSPPIPRLPTSRPALGLLLRRGEMAATRLRRRHLIGSPRYGSIPPGTMLNKAPIPCPPQVCRSSSRCVRSRSWSGVPHAAGTSIRKSTANLIRE